MPKERGSGACRVTGTGAGTRGEVHGERLWGIWLKARHGDSARGEYFGSGGAQRLGDDAG